jgi:hypothetical protein
MIMFEQATRLKLRFRSPNGLIGVEDLWDLPLKTLDSIAVGLRKELRNTEESFLEESTDKTLEQRFNVVKHILEVKKAESQAASEAKEIRAKKQTLMAALERKQNQQLEEMSAEQIQAEIDKLSAK